MKCFMKKLTAALTLLALCCLLFAACGSDPIDPAPVDPDPVPVDPDPVKPDERLETMKKNISAMLPVLDAAARTVAGGSLTYSGSDSFCFWVTLYNFTSTNAAGYTGVTTRSDGTLVIPNKAMTDFASACFSSFKGFPAMPEGFNAVHYDAEADCFYVSAGSLEVAATTDDYEVSGDYYKLTVTLPIGEQPYVLAAVLVDNVSGSDVYPYSILSLKLVSRGDGEGEGA